MSRSIKKHPIIKDNRKYSKWCKKRANRTFRRGTAGTELCSGKSAFHRKYTEKWDIHDYVSRWTKKEAEADWEQEEMYMKNGISSSRYTRWHKTFGTKERFLNYWEKCMRRK